MAMISLLIFIASSAFAGQPKIITIAHAANFSGQSRVSINPVNSTYEDAAKMALREFEGDLKKLNVEIRFVNFDHKTENAHAKITAEEIAKSKAVAVLGFYESEKAIVALPVLKKANLVLVDPTASHIALSESGPNVRTLTINNHQMAEQMLRIAKEKTPGKHALVITEADCAYCVDLETELKEVFAGEDIKVEFKRIHSADRKFDSLVQHAKEFHHDFFIVPNREISSAYLFQQFLENDLTQPFIGGDGWGNSEGPEFFDIVKNPNFVGYSIGRWHPQKTTPLGEEFAKAWENRFYRTPTSDWAMVNEGARFLISNLVEMLKQKTAVTRANVLKKISEVKVYEGLVGRYEFAGPGKPPSRNIVVVKSNNKKKRFEPTELIWVK